MKEKALSIIYILIAGCAWGCMALAVRPLSEKGFSTMDITFLRAIITCVVLGVFLLIYNRETLKVKIKDLWCFVGTGALSVCFFNFCYFKTITLTSMSVAAVMLYTAPSFVMLLSALLFKEKITMKKILAVLVAFAGCCLVSGVVGGSMHLTTGGILFGIGSGIGYALYSIFGRYALNRGYNSITITFYTFFFCSVSSILNVNPIAVTKKVCETSGLIWWTIAMMLFVTLLPYLTYTKGLQKVENSTASVVASIEPVVATVLGIIIYKESIDWYIFSGILLVLFSVIIINSKNKIVQK